MVRRHALVVVLLLIPAVSLAAAGCGARLTPEQRNAVVGRGDSGDGVSGDGVPGDGVQGEGR